MYEDERKKKLREDKKQHCGSRPGSLKSNFFKIQPYVGLVGVPWVKLRMLTVKLGP